MPEPRDTNPLGQLLSDREQQAVLLALAAGNPDGGEPPPDARDAALSWATCVVVAYEILMLAIRGDVALIAAEDGDYHVEPLHGPRLASQKARIREVMAP